MANPRGNTATIFKKCHEPQGEDFHLLHVLPNLNSSFTELNNLTALLLKPGQ